MRIFDSNTIATAMPLQNWVNIMQEAVLSTLKGNYFMPPRPHYDYQGNTLLVMPCFTDDYFATKLVSVFPKNQAINKPSIYGSVILNDGKTGEALALFDGGKLTAMRTGAVGGLAIRHLAKANTKTIGIIGAGIQGLHQALFACCERDIEEVYVFDYSKANKKNFRDEFQNIHSSVQLYFVNSVYSLLEKADIIITATSSEKPVFPEDFSEFKNKSIIGVGSYKPSMQEFSNTLLRSVSCIYSDTEHAKTETGDLINPLQKGWIKEESIIPLAKLIAEKQKPESTVLFKSVGMALFDLFAAKAIYEEALKKNVGLEIKW